MSAKYLQNLSREQYFQLAKALDPYAKDVRISSKGAESVTIVVDTPFFDDGEEGLAEDLYVLDDYSAEPYDSVVHWDEIVEYRKLMLGWFGSEYAEDYLLRESGY